MTLTVRVFGQQLSGLLKKSENLVAILVEVSADTNKFLAKEFLLPEKRSSEPEPDPTLLYQAALNERATEIETLIKCMEESNNKIELLSQVAQEQNAAGSLKEKEISDMHEKLRKMREEYEDMSRKLQNAMEILEILIKSLGKEMK